MAEEEERKIESPKSESPEESLKSNPDSYRDESPKPEDENNSDLTIDGPQSEINKSEIVNRKSERRSPLEHLKKTNNSEKIENMEVHHHPEVEKKGFKEYLLEGLMIFMAVFMGFIAENVRESVVEHNREKEYIREMVNNLKYDTTRCNRNIASDQNNCRGLDSLRDELRKAIAGNVNGNKLYYFSMKYTAGLA
ncbi:MAG TPA: hypothetical protein VFE53_13950, partial [Mucilaginibacter sp.]|nr:hypothetical protein [Mucilaginibacter sp.]